MNRWCRRRVRNWLLSLQQSANEWIGAAGAGWGTECSHSDNQRMNESVLQAQGEELTALTTAISEWMNRCCRRRVRNWLLSLWQSANQWVIQVQHVLPSPKDRFRVKEWKSHLPRQLFILPIYPTCLMQQTLQKIWPYKYFAWPGTKEPCNFTRNK